MQRTFLVVLVAVFSAMVSFAGPKGGSAPTGGGGARVAPAPAQNRGPVVSRGGSGGNSAPANNPGRNVGRGNSNGSGGGVFGYHPIIHSRGSASTSAPKRNSNVSVPSPTQRPTSGATTITKTVNVSSPVVVPQANVSTSITNITYRNGGWWSGGGWCCAFYATVGWGAYGPGYYNYAPGEWYPGGYDGWAFRYILPLPGTSIAQPGIKFDLSEVDKKDRKAVEDGQVFMMMVDGTPRMICLVKNHAGDLKKSLKLRPGPYDLTVELKDGRIFTAKAQVLQQGTTTVGLHFGGQTADKSEDAGSPDVSPSLAVQPTPAGGTQPATEEPVKK
jgi:hypothetical protein